MGALLGSPVPLGFVWGRSDPVVGEHVIRWLSEHLPAAPRLDLDGIGHYPQVEAAAEAAEWIGATSARWLAAPR